MPDQSEPLEPPPPSIPPPPDHVVDPIPPPTKLDGEEVVTSTDAAADLNDPGSDATPDVDPGPAESTGGTERSGAGERVHIEPSDVAAGYYGTENFVNDNPTTPLPPGQSFQDWVDGATTDSQPESGGDDAHHQDAESEHSSAPDARDESTGVERAPWLRLALGAGGLVLILIIVGLLVLANRSAETDLVSLPDQQVETTPDPDPEPATQSDSTEEPTAPEAAAEAEPASNSGHATDPADDNGGDGIGADILGLEYLQEDEFFAVLLSMGFSPLESSILWYSYYLEVTFIRFSGAVQVLIWENHAGVSRSGELDSEGAADGEGVTLTDEAAEFRLGENTADDPVKEIRVKALSLVEQDSPFFTQDEMKVDVGTG